MRRSLLLGNIFLFIFFMAGLAPAQMTPEEIAQDKHWEEFLASADMTIEKHMEGAESVTNPYKLRLEKNGEKRFAIWKNATGRPKGYLENWMWEIAAYRLDRYLGLNMVPVTIERRFQGDRGSLQLWEEGLFPYSEVLAGRKTPPEGLPGVKVNLAVYLQRAFDNLICNEDRHARNIQITSDWRLILIDHGRSFRSRGRYYDKLVFGEKGGKSPGTMAALPAAFVDKLKSLTPEILHRLADPYLTDEEIAAVLLRRDLILKEIDRMIEKFGKSAVIY